MRKALICFFLFFLVSCAKGPRELAPYLFEKTPPALEGLVRYRLEGPGLKLSGKAFLIVSRKTIYLEGRNFWGTSSFSLWIEPYGFYFISYSPFRAYRLLLDPPCPSCQNLWSYLMQGRLPFYLKEELTSKGWVRLGSGYKLRAQSSSGLLILYRERPILKADLSPKRNFFEIIPLRARLQFKWQRRREAALLEIPAPPRLAYQEIKLSLAEYADIETD